MKTHELKTINPFFESLWIREKTFELRKNDRDFQKGDILRLKEYYPETNTYGRREVKAKIGYILDGGQYGLEEGYCILSLKKVETIEWSLAWDNLIN